MAITGWISKNFMNSAAGLKDGIVKYKSKPFFDAIIAATALVAISDGVAAPSEREKVVEFIQSRDDLKVFAEYRVREVFRGYIARLIENTEAERRAIMKMLRRFQRKPEAELIITLCCLVAEAVYNFEDEERHAIRSMCLEMGVSTTKFGI